MFEAGRGGGTRQLLRRCDFLSHSGLPILTLTRTPNLCPQAYRGGVLDCAPGPQAIDHAVTIVAYESNVSMPNGEKWDVFTIKNSWWVAGDADAWGPAGVCVQNAMVGGRWQLLLAAPKARGSANKAHVITLLRTRHYHAQLQPSTHPASHHPTPRGGSWGESGYIRVRDCSGLPGRLIGAAGMFRYEAVVPRRF